MGSEMCIRDRDDEAADSNLVIEPFDASDPVVQRVCDALQVATDRAAGGGRFWWESNLKKAVRNDDYAAVIVDVPEQGNPRKGFLLRDVGYVEKKSVVSTYTFADDGVLTITTRYDTNVGTERCWFVTCLLYTSPSPRDLSTSRMPSSA